MAGYWWFFSFVLAILRPNGILVRHFGFLKRVQLAYKMLRNVLLFLLCYY